MKAKDWKPEQYQYEPTPFFKWYWKNPPFWKNPVKLLLYPFVVIYIFIMFIRIGIDMMGGTRS